MVREVSLMIILELGDINWERAQRKFLDEGNILNPDRIGVYISKKVHRAVYLRLVHITESKLFLNKK